jgi:hypothetical protein
MAFFDVETMMGSAGRRGRPSKKGGIALTTASMGAGNKRNPLHFGRGGKMVQGSGVFSSLLSSIGLGDESESDNEMGGYAKGSKRTPEDIAHTLKLAQHAKLLIKIRANQLEWNGTHTHKQAMAQARAEHKANKKVHKKATKPKTVRKPRAKKMKIPTITITEEGGVGVGGYAVGGLDSGEKRFLRAIKHSPEQAQLANTYGELAENYGGNAYKLVEINKKKGGMSHNKLGMVHKKGEMNMLPHMDGSGVFSSLLSSLGLGVNEHNLALLQQLEQKIEEQLPLEHKGAGRMLIHHVMRNKHGKRNLKGAGWFDDIVNGFTRTIEKIIPLVPAIIPIVKQFMG